MATVITGSPSQRPAPAGSHRWPRPHVGRVSACWSHSGRSQVAPHSGHSARSGMPRRVSAWVIWMGTCWLMVSPQGRGTGCVPGRGRPRPIGCSSICFVQAVRGSIASALMRLEEPPRPASRTRAADNDGTNLNALPWSSCLPRNDYGCGGRLMTDSKSGHFAGGAVSRSLRSHLRKTTQPPGFTI